MNKVNLLGRITKDLELRTTSSGLQTLKFNIAVNRNFKNKDGNYDADFINCIAYKNIAEFINKYFKKGSSIAITGRIQTGSYEDEKGKHYTTDVVIEEVEFVGGAKKEETNIKNEIPQNIKTEYNDLDSAVSLSDKELDEVFNKNNEQFELPF